MIEPTINDHLREADMTQLDAERFLALILAALTGSDIPEGNVPDAYGLAPRAYSVACGARRLRDLAEQVLAIIGDPRAVGATAVEKQEFRHDH